MECTEMLDTKVSRRTLALAKEHIWWPKMVEDCRALVKGCQCCQIFEGAVVKALLCPIKAFAPLEVGSHGLYEHRNNYEVEPAAKCKECTGHHGPFYEILYSVRH